MLDVRVACPSCGSPVSGRVPPLPSRVRLPCPACAGAVDVALRAFPTSRGTVVAITGVAAADPAGTSRRAPGTTTARR